MTKEEEWIEAVANRIRTEGQLEELDGIPVRVGTGARLPYTYEGLDLEAKEQAKSGSIDYQTDLLLYDQLDSGWWAPRVVIECKLGKVASNNALAFRARAARHKHVHYYLRYGVLIGSKNHFSVAGERMFRHGDSFDFVARWSDGNANETEWTLFAEILREEVQRSRTIQELFAIKQYTTKYSVVHRRLSFK
jgi:hypothetical protein